jgi:hypothetical protein
VAGKPLKSKGDAHEVFKYVCRRYGIPKVLVNDRVKEENLGLWGCIVVQNLIPQSNTEPQSGWQNKCESELREFRKHFQRIMMLNKCPETFWDFALEYIIPIWQSVVWRAAKDRSPMDTATGNTMDIHNFSNIETLSMIETTQFN